MYRWYVILPIDKMANVSVKSRTFNESMTLCRWNREARRRLTHGTPQHTWGNLKFKFFFSAFEIVISWESSMCRPTNGNCIFYLWNYRSIYWLVLLSIFFSCCTHAFDFHAKCNCVKCRRVSFRLLWIEFRETYVNIFQLK